MNTLNKQCIRCGLPQSEWPDGRWKDPLCKIGETMYETHALSESNPEKSVEEIVEELAERFCWNELIQRMDGSHWTETELKEEIRSVLQAERQKRGEMVEATLKKVQSYSTYSARFLNGTTYGVSKGYFYLREKLQALTKPQ